MPLGRRQSTLCPTSFGLLTPCAAELVCELARRADLYLMCHVADDIGEAVVRGALEHAGVTGSQRGQVKPHRRVVAELLVMCVFQSFMGRFDLQSDRQPARGGSKPHRRAGACCGSQDVPLLLLPKGRHRQPAGAGRAAQASRGAPRGVMCRVAAQVLHSCLAVCLLKLAPCAPPLLHGRRCRVLFCGTLEGKVPLVRQLEPELHIDGSEKTVGSPGSQGRGSGTGQGRAAHDGGWRGSDEAARFGAGLRRGGAVAN